MCAWCLFGIHLEDEPNRIQKLKEDDPKIYNYCINNLGLKEVLNYINVPYK